MTRKSDGAVPRRAGTMEDRLAAVVEEGKNCLKTQDSMERKEPLQLRAQWGLP